MLTLFTIPKAFEGHAGVIQRNALGSWTRLAADVEVIVFGDDPGVAGAAADLGVRHHPEIARNELGTPLVSDAFARAQTMARHPIVCYANSDIIFVEDFIPGVAAVRGWRPSFLLAGRRWNLPVPDPLPFSEGWQTPLCARARAEGDLQDEWWIDYFVFPRGFITSMPAFAIGRAAWDNWLIYRVRCNRVPVVDATDDITAIHQDHGYQHVPFSKGAWKGPESDRNLELAGGRDCLYSLADATHRLAGGHVGRRASLSGLRRALGVTSFRSFFRGRS